jgi:hypothetical protein
MKSTSNIRTHHARLSKSVRLRPISPLPDERRRQFGHHGILVQDNIEAGCNEAKPNDLDDIATERFHPIRKVLDLGLAAGLAVTDNEHPICPPQRCNFRKRHMPVGQTFPLNSVIRIKEDQVGVAYQMDQALGPRRAQRSLFGHFPTNEDRVSQQSARLQCGHGISGRAVTADEFRQLIIHFRREMPVFGGPSEVIEMPFGILHLIVCTGKVPANRKATILFKMSQKSELSEIADPSYMLNLHDSPSNQQRMA